MCPSAPKVCSEPGDQKPVHVLSLSLDLIGTQWKLPAINHDNKFQSLHNNFIRVKLNKYIIYFNKTLPEDVNFNVNIYKYW